MRLRPRLRLTDASGKLEANLILQAAEPPAAHPAPDPGLGRFPFRAIRTP